MSNLLRIIVGEQEFADGSGNIYEWVKEFLWEKGFPGLTVRRGELSLDYHGKEHSVVIEDIAFNDLAVIMESIAEEDHIDKVKRELIENIPHGQVSVVKGMDESDMKNHDYFVVKVYTKEDNSWFKKEEYEKVLEFFQKKKAIWATVSKGIVGYGKDRVVHRQRAFAFSEKMPVIIECIVPSEHLKDLLDELKIIVEEGAVFTAPVDMIMNR